MVTQYKVGDVVTSDFYRGEPADVTEITERGFRYVLRKPHSLGPRHGFIDAGEAYTDEGWCYYGDQHLWRQVPRVP